MRKRFLLNEDIEDLGIGDADGMIPVSIDAEDTPVDEPAVDDKMEAIGVTQMLSALIQDEWKTIDSYKSTVATLRDMGGHDAEIKVLEDVIAEEMTHVGQLEACVKGSAPEAHEIESGKEEAEEQMAEAEHPIDESKRMREGVLGRKLHESLTYSGEYDGSTAYWMEVAKDEFEWLKDDAESETGRLYGATFEPLLGMTEENEKKLCEAVAEDMLDSDYLWEEIGTLVRDSIKKHQMEFQPEMVEFNPAEEEGNNEN